MSTLLSACNLTKSHLSIKLFVGVSIHVSAGDRIGLIGPNGAGKSTLLKILSGLEPSDEGEITRRRDLKIAYVDQDDRFPPGATPMSVVIEAITNDNGGRLDIETRASIALSKLGFISFDQPVDSLSGGWRKRLSLARAIGQDPNVLLLDEPTNHLDLEGVLWLEGFVRRSPMAMIFITHDRRFLERAANRIIELSPAYPGGTFEVCGNYSEFVRRKEAFLEAQQVAESSLANMVRRDTAWLQQGIQGRQTRNKSQVDAADDRRAALAATKSRNAAPSRTTTIDFQATERKTRNLLALHNVSKSMGDKRLFESLDLKLSPGQRIGLLGVNGAGKTTLLRLMAGELAPDAGTVKRADGLRIVTFSQHRGTLKATQTLQEALCPVGDTVNYRGKPVHVSGWARRFLFDTDQLSTLVGNLSGGEQARVLIANLMLEPADVLLLDEPTNDLDIPSLEVLEQALLEFPGAIVLVTHDRFMLERIATEYIGLDDSGGAKAFETYDQWNRFWTAASSSSSLKNRAPDDSKRRKQTAPPHRKLTFGERHEYNGIEQAILDAEREVSRLDAEIADPTLASDHVRASQTYAALSAAQFAVEKLYVRWAELETIANGE